jgi:hypothetical protein
VTGAFEVSGRRTSVARPVGAAACFATGGDGGVGVGVGVGVGAAGSSPRVASM